MSSPIAACVVAEGALGRRVEVEDAPPASIVTCSRARPRAWPGVGLAVGDRALGGRRSTRPHLVAEPPAAPSSTSGSRGRPCRTAPPRRPRRARCAPGSTARCRPDAPAPARAGTSGPRRRRRSSPAGPSPRHAPGKALAGRERSEQVALELARRCRGRPTSANAAQRPARRPAPTRPRRPSPAPRQSARRRDS